MATETLRLQKHTSSRSVVEEIWDDLRGLILRGVLTPGTRLVELEIAAHTHASQVSVRGALQRLERDGLVVRRGRSGTFVADVVPEDMHEVFDVRAVAEVAAIRRTARLIRPAQLGELRELVERMGEAAREDDAVTLVKHDMAFHRNLYVWSDHDTLLRLWTLIQAQLERYLIIYDASNLADLAEVADCHTPLVEALSARDADAAAELIRQHVQRIPDRMRQIS